MFWVMVMVGLFLLGVDGDEWFQLEPVQVQGRELRFGGVSYRQGAEYALTSRSCLVPLYTS